MSIIRAQFARAGGVLLCAPMLSFAPLAAQSAPASRSAEPYPGLDAYITAALKTWQVPGLALAIVRNDSVIYARGYGVRELGKPALVDDRTIFAIGSASKAFTAAAVAMLVDEKKLSLDAPATSYLPTFQLFDPYATRELTVRDLLSHRSGLARGEMVWYGSGYDRDEILRHIRFLQPSWSFRAQFGYQNIMYLAAGQIVAHVANTTWDDFVAQRIFAPLGMSSTFSRFAGVAGQQDLATPHAVVDDSVHPVAWRNMDNVGPAGSVNSNAVDMAQWVRLQLGAGTFNGKQLVSRKLMDDMHTPQIVIPLDTTAKRNNPDTHFSAYGMGWFLEDYRGREVWHHGGNVDGFTALVAMLPEEKFGLVMLANMNGTGLPNALMHKLFDWHLKAPARDWSGDMRKRTEAQRARTKEAEKRLESQRIANTKPSLPLAAYAGTYVDSLYGEVRVSENAGKLRLDYGPNWQADLQHWHFDVFRARFATTPVIGPFFVEFRPGPSGKVDDVQLNMLATKTVFHRRPTRADSATVAPTSPQR